MTSDQIILIILAFPAVICLVKEIGPELARLLRELL